MIIAIDFDGTIVDHNYPHIGEPVPNAIECMKFFNENNHDIILNTMRSGKHLDQAVKYLEDNGIILFGINENPEQRRWTDSPKIYANYYIDDASIGCPLIKIDGFYRWCVDWEKVLKLFYGTPIEEIVCKK